MVRILGMGFWFQKKGGSLRRRSPLKFEEAKPPKIPYIYQREGRERSPSKMNKVIFRANSIAVACFSFIGVMGYLIFADRPHEQIISDVRSKNILEADFGSSKLI